MQSILLYLFILQAAGHQHLLNNKVPFVFDLEVWRNVWHTIQKGLDRQSRWLDRSLVGDVVGKSQDDVVFDAIVEIGWVQLFADITKGC